MTTVPILSVVGVAAPWGLFDGKECEYSFILESSSVTEDCRVPTLPTMSPHSTGGATGNSVLQTAGWCGIVVSLVCLFAVLNVAPPVDVTYRSETQVILSPIRVQQLQSYAASAAESVDSAPDDTLLDGQLLEIEVLDRLDGSAEGRVASDASQVSAGLGSDELLLVKVTSRWREQQSPEGLYRWIEKASSLPVARDDANVARKLRFYRWQMSTAEHYVDRYQHVEAAKKSPARENGRTFQLASAVTEVEGVPAEVAVEAERQKTADELLEQVDLAGRRFAASLASWEHHVDSLSGEFRPAGRSTIEAKPSRIPSFFAASVLVLGLAIGSIAGWIQFRLQSGGAYSPAMVAQQLARDGVPQVGNIDLPGALSGRPSIARRISAFGRDLPRLFARRFTRVSELALLGWCGLIVFRFIAEPLWRDVLATSPLAVFGRLIAGLP